jgi:hypothetical protein
MKSRKVSKNIKNNNSADISLSQKRQGFYFALRAICGVFFTKRGGVK